MQQQGGPARSVPERFVTARIAAEAADSCELVGGRADGGLVLVCDHASNALPPAYGTLGLSAAELERHIAFDIGAAAVTREIAAELDVPAVLTRYSRLLIDTNRGTDDPTLVMRLSDGAIIPGNRHLDEAEREARIARYYRPYHDAITRVLGACSQAGAQPMLLGVHSYTESWKGVARPWHASVLWDGDPRLASPLLDALRSEPGLVIGENEPYPGQYEGDTLWQHGACRGLTHAIVEVRQNEIDSCEGQLAWGRLLARLLRPLCHATSVAGRV